MRPSPTKLVCLDLPCNAQAPAVARDALRQMAGAGDRTGDVVLVADELVTNAVLHSGGSEDLMIEVRVSRPSGCLLISVRDPGRPGDRAQLRPEQPIGGWGLRIVAQLAVRWGSEPDGTHHHVWAEVALPAA